MMSSNWQKSSQITSSAVSQIGVSKRQDAQLRIRVQFLRKERLERESR